MTVINFNDLSDLGLIYEINKQVLHPLGLALMRNPEDGTSAGVIIDDKDFKWEYARNIVQENEEKLKKFKDNRIGILKEYISTRYDN